MINIMTIIIIMVKTIISIIITVLRRRRRIMITMMIITFNPRLPLYYSGKKVHVVPSASGQTSAPVKDELLPERYQTLILLVLSCRKMEYRVLFLNCLYHYLFLELFLDLLGCLLSIYLSVFS